MPDDKEYLFLPEDFAQVNARLEQLEEAMRKNRAAVADTSSQSSESWHDNPMFDYNNREFDVLSKQHSDLANIVAHARIVTSDATSDGAYLGSRVTFARDSSASSESLVLCSYRIIQSPDEDTDRVSYSSPLGQLLLGAREGESRDGEINGKNITIRVLKVD